MATTKFSNHSCNARGRFIVPPVIGTPPFRGPDVHLFTKIWCRIEKKVEGKLLTAMLATRDVRQVAAAFCSARRWLGTTNWAGNIKWEHAETKAPSSVEELQDLVKAVPDNGSLRVRGSGHSFVPIADVQGEGAVVTLRNLPRRYKLDKEQSQVTVDGKSYKSQCSMLEGGKSNLLTPSPALSYTHTHDGVRGCDG